MGTHPIFESDFDCLTEMISRLSFSLRPVLLKQSFRSVYVTSVAARGRPSNIPDGAIETRRETRKETPKETQKENRNAMIDEEWDTTPRNVWISDSLPETAVLKQHSLNPKFDAENILKNSKLGFTSRTLSSMAVSGFLFTGLLVYFPGTLGLVMALMPITIAQQIFPPRAFESRLQKASAIYFDPSTGITSIPLTNTDYVSPKMLKKIDEIPYIIVNIPPVLNETGHEAIIKEAESLERFSHIFDKKETKFDKISGNIGGIMAKKIATKIVTNLAENKVNPVGKNRARGAALLMIDQEIPIRPLSNTSTDGIATLISIDLEKASEDEAWLSTDLMQYMKERKEKEQPFEPPFKKPEK